MKIILTEKSSMKKKFLDALKGESEKIKVVNTVGHIESLASLVSYLENKLNGNHSWYEIIKHLPFIPEKFEHVIKNEEVFEKILEAFKEAEEIILACDPDREGELIQRNILEIAKKLGAVNTENISRIWLHSETKPEIVNAFKKRKHYFEYDGYYQAALVRELIDWLVGIQLTILYTVKYGKSGKTISIGRVQTWLLAEIVKRYLDNKHFKKEEFLTLHFKTADNVIFNLVDEEFKIKKFFGENIEKAKEFESKYKNNFPFVRKIKVKKFIQYAPKLYDLKTLQKDAAALYNISPEDTLKIAQDLYDKHHLISYPRTDCNVLSPQEADLIEGSLDLIKKFGYTKLVNKVNELNPELKFDIKYIGKLKGHYAIIPVIAYDKNEIPELNDNEFKIFYLIVMRLLSALLPPARGAVTEVIAEMEKERFLAKFKNYSSYGFKEFIQSTNKNSDQDKDNSVHEKINIHEGENLFGELFNKQGVTKPPKLFNDTGLLTLMENAHVSIKDENLKSALKNASGIGTASTRASFAPLLIKRGYITKTKGVYIPAELGIKLYELLPTDLILPDFSANIENELSEIVSGKCKSVNEYIADTKSLLSKIFEEVANKKYDNLLYNTDSYGQCPKCGKGFVIKKEKGFFCSDYNCDFVIWKSYNNAFVENEIKNLLVDGETKYELLMKSKNGNMFKAKLKLNRDTWKIDYVFSKKKKSNVSELSVKQKAVIEKNAPPEIVELVNSGNIKAGLDFLREYFNNLKNKKDAA